MTKRLLIYFGVLALVCTFPALAQGIPHGQPLTAHTEGSTAGVAQPDSTLPAGSVIIYNSFGPKGDLYNINDGYYILGNLNPSITPGMSQSIALNFHATANEHVTFVYIPVLFLNAGDGAANTFNVTIYKDAGGLPGVAIPPSVASMSNGNFGAACCPYVTVAFPGGGIPLTANQKYWVVVDTMPPSTTEDVWDFTYLTAAVNVAGAGWTATGSYLPTARVVGTIP